MLRRLETYGFHPDDHARAGRRARAVLRRTGWFIPEVLDSAVGQNRSSAGVDLVWEHSYESPEAYARYMCHPYHICILDRYLLPEAPECITASRPRADARLDGLRDRRRAVPSRRRHPPHRRAEGRAGSRRLRALRGRARTRGPAARACRSSRANTMGLEWFPTGGRTSGSRRTTTTRRCRRATSRRSRSARARAGHRVDRRPLRDRPREAPARRPVDDLPRGVGRRPARRRRRVRRRLRDALPAGRARPRHGARGLLAHAEADRRGRHRDGDLPAPGLGGVGADPQRRRRRPGRGRVGRGAARPHAARARGSSTSRPRSRRSPPSPPAPS